MSLENGANGEGDELPSTKEGVEDVPSQSSPSRPGPKPVETVHPVGYLKFLSILHPLILSIIYWKDVKLSAISLAMSMVILLTLYINTLFHSIVLMLIAGLIVSLVFIVTKMAVDSFYNKPIQNPFEQYFDNDIVFINKDVAVKITEQIVAEINCIGNLVTKLLFYKDWLSSLKFLVILYMASYITNYLSVITILFWKTVFLFGVPPIYTLYQQQIEDFIDNGTKFIADQYNKLSAKIPYLPKPKSE